ncbi:patatin-like phospholipase family protein [Methylobacterium sp. NEAU K]|uniref:patatin-like phospholipase family protein n=1 Tax=Methylobacterium sp. NEAU K TaxID=3064946 RepID=UPI00273530CA|nr:patatin-like phospholipase family protein [Methylobacterium sp. NEAU K]MDP4006394.1 patatin-like phospholipase family protein [Methylobacterium sp. NEAU K]
MRAFGVFEGGGVRGYAHLGALKACEDKGIRFAGVSGTSIGAIVAALVAAGYTSTELYEADDHGRESGLFAVDVIKEFLDPIEYGRLKRLRTWLDRCSQMSAQGRGIVKAMKGRAAGRAWSRFVSPKLLSFGRRYLRSLEFASIAAPPAYATAVPLAAFHWKLLRTVYGRSGVLDSARFTAWLNDRLGERLGLQPGTIVTFWHLPIPLACIATNLSTGKMVVFDRASNPRMSVAEAAMASASYPLVFKPRRIDDDAYVDGGLLSNFPAWTLDSERANQESIIPTFGFRVDDALIDEAKAWPGDGEPGLVEVARRIISAAMWGRGDLESRRIDDLHPMRVRTHVKSTDFHTIMKERLGLYREGRACVQAYFASQLGPRDPGEMQGRLRKVCDIVRDVASASGIVRAYLIQPTDAQFARVVYSAFYEGEADDVLTFRRGSATQVICLDRREPVLLRVADLDEAARQAPATKLIHALRPTRVTHVYCVPMFADPVEWSKGCPSTRTEPVAALCIDFDEADDRLLLEAYVEDTLAAIGDALVDLWMDRAGYGLADLSAGGDQPPSSDWMPLPQAGYYVSARKTKTCPSPDRQLQIDRATR